MSDEVRKELVSYYKWIVSLAIFAITVAISLISSVESIHITKVGKIGLALLTISIFFNWVLIKRLITAPIVEGTPTERKGVIHNIFEEGSGNIKWYALLQNLTFIVGISLEFLVHFLFNYKYEGK